MKKGFKNFLIICAILVAVGIALTAIGYALGGVADVSLGNLKVVSFDINNNAHNKRLNTYIAKEEVISESFNNIQINTDLYDIEFLPGSEYKVEYTYIEDLEPPKISVENETLYIKSENNDDKINTSLLSLFSNNKQDLTLKVYYPTGAELDNVNIENNLGDVDIEGINCGILIANLDLGDIELKNVNASMSNINLALGDFSAENFETGSLRAEINKGDVEINGKIGNTDIECDMGDVDIETSLKKEEYNCSFKVELGELTIDGKTLENSIVSNYDEAENNMTVTCSLGDIDIDFGK